MKDELFLDYRNLLFSIAYDMLGNVSEAEDMVQETYIRWTTSNGTVSHPKAYLVKIVTNLCINYLDLARKKREKYVGVWLPGPVIQKAGNTFQPGEIYHALSIGLMVVLEKLTPVERAVFLLKEIFSYDHQEIGEIIGKTEDNCRQLLARAKKQLDNDHKRFQIDLAAHEEILRRFIDACRNGDMESLIGMLKEDITLYADGGGSTFEVNKQRITAAAHPIHGRETVATFLINITARFRSMAPNAGYKVMLVNGSPALVNYSGDRPVNIISLQVEDGKIAQVYGHSNPEKISASGLMS
jgi:RNA polymerase sigma-70 factor (ECF subfamily)